ncbi:tRNA pseudouridine(38-40) synthase TruA [Propionibacterium acidifaciens]|uniref:tRNA pseudouridine(38-40) synthase TruA n=1 Tax=Propionibacterium acidifaciens TaxID=556499 RepID=UPI00360B8650
MSPGTARAGTRRLRLDIGYDGTGFHGWAAQPGLRTVEGELARWIGRLARLGTDAELTVAGRTDAGVHARGQVAHVDLPAGVAPEALAHRLRRVLPPDLVVHRIVGAPAGFDARFAALWRRYVYRLWDERSRPDPLMRGHVTAVGGVLDTAAMTGAGARLLGLRDFAAFCRRREGATTIRTLLECTAVRADDPCGTVELTVRADAFCHSMVRSLTGALVAVGTGRRPPEWIDEVAASTRRHGGVTVMPPGGLCLEEVGYPDEGALAERADRARAVRTLPPDDCCTTEG